MSPPWNYSGNRKGHAGQVESQPQKVEYFWHRSQLKADLPAAGDHGPSGVQIISSVDVLAEGWIVFPLISGPRQLGVGVRRPD